MGERGDLGSKGPQGAKVWSATIRNVNASVHPFASFWHPQPRVAEFQGELSYMQAPKEVYYT